MQAYKKLEFYVAEVLNWIRRGKSHYGESIWDVEGDGFRGDTKLYLKMRIHTMFEKAQGLYGNNTILFTKLKNTHYGYYNVLVHLNLEQFNVLLKCKRIAETVDKKKINQVDDRLTILLKDMSYNLESIKLSYQKMKKIMKKIEEMK